MLGRLADTGNTVVVIEHNLDVIKSADWVIDLGPEGGDAGGDLVASGTPEQVAKVPASHTGRYLRRVLGVKESSRLDAAAPATPSPPEQDVSPVVESGHNAIALTEEAGCPRSWL